MKKQLIAAAVAATMTSVAMADISITGAGMVKFVSTDAGTGGTDSHLTSQEVDLKVTGKLGDTTVVSAFDMDGATTVGQGDQYMTTKIGDVNLKAGYFIGGKSDLTKRSARADKISASMNVGPAKITYENNASNTSGAVYLSADLGPVAAAYKDKDGTDEVILSTTVSGISVSYRGIDSDTANSDRSIVKVSGSFGGVDLTYASAETDSQVRVDGDGYFGDFNGSNGTTYTAGNGADVTGLSATMNAAGNKITFKTVDVDETTGNDTKINQIVATRALAAGTTLTTKYTMTDVDGGTSSDTDALELKLSVAF